MAVRSAPVRSISWGRIGLAVLPGVWLILQHRRAYTSSPLFELGTFVVTVLISLGLVVTSLLVERRLAPWCLPAVGCFLWKASRTREYLQFARRANILEPLSRLDNWRNNLLARPPMQTILELTGGILAILMVGSGLFIAYWIVRWLIKQRSRLVWGLLCLLVIATLTLRYLEYPGRSLCVLGMLLGRSIFALLSVSVPIAIGRLLVKRDGLAAGLLVVPFGPLLITALFRPDGIFYKLLPRMYDASSTMEQELALLVLSCLPLVCFFVVIPIGLLTARSAKAQLGWLVLPSLLILVSMALIRGLALAGTEFEYSLTDWVASSLHVIQLWIPFVLTGIIYREDSQVDSGDMETKSSLVLHQGHG